MNRGLRFLIAGLETQRTRFPTSGAGSPLRPRTIATIGAVKSGACLSGSALPGRERVPWVVAVPEGSSDLRQINFSMYLYIFTLKLPAGKKQRRASFQDLHRNFYLWPGKRRILLKAKEISSGTKRWR